ncbi:MAG TPA: hypothetical protein VG755_14160 [Nannocystaceae bacterium]|nr:hypothetical protein [Nannocystaceae bacterium]
MAAGAAAELRARGQQVELVELAADDAPVLEACARASGRGLFVVARGAGLDGPRADRLRQVLRDLGVPMSRSLALSLDLATRTSFVDRVIIVARRIGAAAEGPLPAPAPKLRPSGAEASSTASVGVAALAAGDAARTEPIAPTRSDTIPPARPGTAPHVHLGAEGTHKRSRVPFALFAATLGVAALVALTNAREEPAITDLEYRADDEAPKLAHAPTIPSATTPAPVDDDEPIVDDAQVSAAETLAEDAPAIVDALKKREIRALDVFIVSPEAKKAAEFAGAAKYCEKLKVSGIGDWRLPEIGELISMSRAKMVRKGSFWSSTKGDTFGDLRLVLVIKRERISPIPAGWDGGRIICVRERA